MVIISLVVRGFLGRCHAKRCQIQANQEALMAQELAKEIERLGRENESSQTKKVEEDKDIPEG